VANAPHPANPLAKPLAPLATKFANTANDFLKIQLPVLAGSFLLFMLCER